MTSENDPIKPNSRLFSIEEANNLIPKLERDFLILRELNQEVTAIIREKELLSKGNGDINLNADRVPVDLELLTKNLESISKMIGDILKIGIHVKDIDAGLVDFPHLRDGNIVYLCWQSGEKSIGYWHELDSGKAGRKPL